MNHLAEEEHPLAGIFFQCPIAYFNGVFNAITKTKVTGKDKLYRTEVENRGRKILFAQVFGTAEIFDATCQRGAIKGGNVKFLDGRFSLTDTKVA